MKIVDEPSLREKTAIFRDRFHAGELLSHKLEEYGESEAIVMAIPAGGVPVGIMLSKTLHIPLDLMIVRKLHIPWNPEAGFGAISWDGTVILNESLIPYLGLSEDEIKECIEIEMREVRKRVELLRGERKFPDLRNKTVILTDDGLASGYTMLAAVRTAATKKPREIVVAVPTGSREAVNLVSEYVDKLVCLNIRSSRIFAVADAYQEWRDLTDEEVKQILIKHGFFKG